MAPKTWRQKFEVAERRRNREFNSRERFVEALNDFLPEVLKEREKKARAILDKHKGIMPRALYNKFLRCTHTDTTRNVSDQELNEVHRFLTEHKAMLVAREKPMPGMGLPRTHAEWEAMKQKATEAKKAKRAASLARR